MSMMEPLPLDAPTEQHELHLVPNEPEKSIPRKAIEFIGEIALVAFFWRESH